MSFSARVALAIAFSPLVVVGQYFVLRRIGLSFDASVPVLLAVNSAALVLVFLRRPWSAPNWPRVAMGCLLFAAVAGCTAIPWILKPEFRRFSWHGLMHTDISYSCARASFAPEDPELAGIALGYPWFGELFWALASKAADCPPTTTYIVTQLIWLAACGMLTYSLARELGASPSTSFIVPALLALGTNLTGVAAWSLSSPRRGELFMTIFGDNRNAPFLIKFITMNEMPFGLALFCGLVLLAVALLRRRCEFDLIATIPLCLFGIAALYPNIFPAACCVAALLVLLLLRGSRHADVRYSFRVVVGSGVCLAAAIATGGAICKLFLGDRTAATLALGAPTEMLRKLASDVIALAPFMLGVLLLWRAQPREDRAPLTLLTLGTVTAVLLNVVLHVGGENEYKFFQCAGICIAAAACAGFERLVPAMQRAGWIIVAVLVVSLAASTTSFALHRTPQSSPLAGDIRDDGFELTLAATNPHAHWIDAVRHHTPADTIVIARHVGFIASALTNRSLLAPADPQTACLGYNLRPEYNLVDLRGYDRDMFRRRIELVDRVLGEWSDQSWQSLMRDLETFRRPFAILASPQDNHGFLDSLVQSRMGRVLERDGEGRTLYYIEIAGFANVCLDPAVPAPNTQPVQSKDALPTR